MVVKLPTAKRPIEWVASSNKDLRSFPTSVRQEIGHALWAAQCGGKHPAAKPMKGFGGAHTLEIVEDDDGNTYRAVYTLRFEGVIYVLHAFQKKSRQGTKTDRADLRLIEERMKVAQDHHKENYAPKQFGRGTGNG